jgi:hypothetical protein
MNQNFKCFYLLAFAIHIYNPTYTSTKAIIIVCYRNTKTQSMQLSNFFIKLIFTCVLLLETEHVWIQCSFGIRRYKLFNPSLPPPMTWCHHHIMTRGHYQDMPAGQSRNVKWSATLNINWSLPHNIQMANNTYHPFTTT